MSSAQNASTPITSRPSIAQQRIILVVFFALVCAIAHWQNAGSDSSYPIQKFSRTPVPEVVNGLDFTSAEAAWSGLTIDSQGNLLVDALTETALVDAIALMHDQTGHSMVRMGLLLEKQFGAPASQQIMALLPKLKSYKEAEQRWWEKNGSRNPPPHAELFRLQDELLGATLAEKMFLEQRRLLKTMQAILEIRNDTSLTQPQKDQAMINLQGPLNEAAKSGPESGPESGSESDQRAD